MSVKEARRSDRFAQLAIAASTQAVADAGWDLDDPPADPADLGCVIGSGIGGMWTFESQTSRAAATAGPSASRRWRSR